MLWTKPMLTGHAPGPRHGHAAVALGDEIFFFGGMSDAGYSNELFVLQLDADLLGTGFS